MGTARCAPMQGGGRGCLIPGAIRVAFKLLVVEPTKLHEKFQRLPTRFRIFLNEGRPSISAIRKAVSVVLGDELVESRGDNLIQLPSYLFANHFTAGCLIARKKCNETVKMVVTITPIHIWKLDDVVEHTVALNIFSFGHKRQFVEANVNFKGHRTGVGPFNTSTGYGHSVCAFAISLHVHFFNSGNSATEGRSNGIQKLCRPSIRAGD